MICKIYSYFGVVEMLYKGLTMLTKVKLSSLIEDMAFQPRTGINMDHVDAIHAAIDDGTFEEKKYPIHAWKIGKDLKIVDGFHRYKAFKKHQFLEVHVFVHQTPATPGESPDLLAERTVAEALKFAIKANSHMGSPLRRSRADNRRAIQLLLENPATRKLTDNAIAGIVGVTHPTVATIRATQPEYKTDTRIASDGRSVVAEKHATRKKPVESLPVKQHDEKPVELEQDPEFEEMFKIIAESFQQMIFDARTQWTDKQLARLRKEVENLFTCTVPASHMEV